MEFQKTVLGTSLIKSSYFLKASKKGKKKKEKKKKKKKENVWIEWILN